jgi:hypothetical protein
MVKLWLVLALVMGSGLACISAEMTFRVEQQADGEELITISIAQHLTDAYTAAARAANVDRAQDYLAAGLPAPDPFPESWEGMGQQANVPAGLSIVEQDDRGYTAAGAFSSMHEVDSSLAEGVSLSINRDEPSQIRYSVRLRLKEIGPDVDLAGLDALQQGGPGPKPPVNQESAGSEGSGGLLGGLAAMGEILSAATTDDLDTWYLRRILLEAGPPEIKYIVELPGEIVLHTVDGQTVGQLNAERDQVTLRMDADFVNRFGGGTHYFQVESVANACEEICNAMPHMMWDGQPDGASCGCICEEGWQANEVGDCVACDQICAALDARATNDAANSRPNSCACQCTGRLLEFADSEGCRCVTGAEPAGDECRCKPGWESDSWGTGCVESDHADGAASGVPAVGLGADSAGADTTGGDAAGGDSAGADTTGGDVAGGGTAGTDAAGGDAAGGDTTGGDAAGGDTTGGDAAGGDATGGDATSAPSAGPSGPSAGQAAAGAVAVSTLVAGWALSQIQPGTKGPTADWKPQTESVPAETPDPPQLLPSVDPQLLQQLETRFQDMVDQRIKEGYVVTNADFIRKVWHMTLGQVPDWWLGYHEGYCQEFAAWGMKWSGDQKSPGFVQELFGEHVIVDTIFVREQSSGHPDGPVDWADSLVQANHTATRVILPTGESYVLDYWAAVGERQSDPSADVKLIPEQEWIEKWTQAIGKNDCEVYNLHASQRYFREMVAQSDSFEEACERFRNLRPATRGDDARVEMIINNWIRTPWVRYPIPDDA